MGPLPERRALQVAGEFSSQMSHGEALFRIGLVLSLKRSCANGLKRAAVILRGGAQRSEVNPSTAGRAGLPLVDARVSTDMATRAGLA